MYIHRDLPIIDKKIIMLTVGLCLYIYTSYRIDPTKSPRQRPSRKLSFLEADVQQLRKRKEELERENEVCGSAHMLVV